MFPNLEPHTEAFHSVTTSDMQSGPCPVTSSTPMYKPYSILPSTDEIRVVHTPETLVATFVHTIPNSPSVLDNETSQQAEAEITRLKNRILILVSRHKPSVDYIFLSYTLDWVLRLTFYFPLYSIGRETE